MPMLRRALFYAMAALLFLLVMRWGAIVRAHQARQRTALPVTAIHIRHSTRRDLRMAPTLPASDFPGDPLAQNAYAAAAKIAPLLEQLPSQCSIKGHANLLVCFQNRQAARCIACQEEDYYAYQKSREGVKARDIRLEILRGAWKNVNLSRWKSPRS